MTQQDLMDELEQLERDLGHTLDYIRFSASDLHGIARGHIVPRRHVKSTFKSGVSLFAGIVAVGARTELTPISEVLDLHLPNCRLMPVASTLHYLPWAGRSLKSNKVQGEDRKPHIGQVICEFHWVPPLHEGLTMAADPRYAAQRQLTRLEQLGFTIMSAFETEFILLNADTHNPVFAGVDAATILRLSEFEEFLCELERELFESKVDLEGMVVEHGEGQFELGMQPVWGMDVCDSQFKIKMALKEKAQNKGWIATMMARPSKCTTTNGLHLNQSLWSMDKSKNFFFDASKPFGHSDLMRHWIAGLLKHGKAMAALCCPTLNCYRRMHRFLAPDKVEWGIDDRLVAFRAKGGSASATYVENRLPSGACNPYLAFAATIAAGLDGIQNKLECPPPRMESFTIADICKEVTPLSDTDDIKFFPYSLEEALKCLEDDPVLKDAIGPELIEWFVKEKKFNEIGNNWNANVEDDIAREDHLYLEFF